MPYDMLDVMCRSFEDTCDLILLGQVMRNPKSNVALNELIDEKLDSRFEAFWSVNKFLKDMVDRLETRISALHEENTCLRIKAEAMHVELGAKSGAVMSLEAINQHLAQENAGLRAKIEAMYAEFGSKTEAMHAEFRAKSEAAASHDAVNQYLKAQNDKLESSHAQLVQQVLVNNKSA